MKAVTAAEFRCTREHLGLPLGWLATNFGVTERTVYRWEQGIVPIPDYGSEALIFLSAYATDCVNFQARHWPKGAPLVTYTDAVTSVAPDSYPASWHRALVYRVAAKISRPIVYDDDASGAVSPPCLAPLPHVDQS